ncbi:hypothetical protein [Cupriavidus taiwanensis]|uniref:hypothetical protein n=1 Tax=Cupriavidus taiwanensis TaxID=164546 RepID=UPI0011AE32BE|nr:hypothetical protein [Cupriavidus taiwanensis]
MGLLEQVPGNGARGGQVIRRYHSTETRLRARFSFFRQDGWSAGATEIVASEKNDKSGNRSCRSCGNEVPVEPPVMYASAINGGKIAQFFEVMSCAAVSEMPNLLSEPDFSSYTIKTLLKSDVQPVQVVGPS